MWAAFQSRCLPPARLTSPATNRLLPLENQKSQSRVKLCNLNDHGTVFVPAKSVGKLAVDLGVSKKFLARAPARTRARRGANLEGNAPVIATCEWPISRGNDGSIALQKRRPRMRSPARYEERLRINAVTRPAQSLPPLAKPRPLQVLQPLRRSVIPPL